jgi:MGT family glycosyltransferase
MATVVFFPEGAHGPTNNCACIGAVLRERGHRVVFIVEESFAGTLEARGFEERLIRLGPPPVQEEAPGQFWIDFIRDTAPVFRKPTIAQLGEFVAPTFEALCDGARDVHGRLLEIIDELAPDMIVEDNVVSFPALAASGRRWVRIVSCNPLEVRDPALAPVFSGYPEADRSGWEAFREEFRRTHADLHASFDEFRREAGAPPLPGLEFMDTSPYLNLYGYPDEVDYRRSQPLDATWHNVQTSVRTSEDWQLPEHLRDGSGALLYLSLGSLGSADVGLMQRLVDFLAATDHRVIVSKGPLAQQIRLHDNMCGEGYLPQPAILPQVDLVITHGGNNTTCEALHHGKPMVVLPIFWDQYDNAQRVHETGLGLRLSTYGCEAAELTGAVDRLLADAPLRARLAAMAERLQRRSGTLVAADLIEQLASPSGSQSSGSQTRHGTSRRTRRDQAR